MNVTTFFAVGTAVGSIAGGTSVGTTPGASVAGTAGASVTTVVDVAVAHADNITEAIIKSENNILKRRISFSSYFFSIVVLSFNNIRASAYLGSNISILCLPPPMNGTGIYIYLYANEKLY
jgi:hypothetical protein